MSDELRKLKQELEAARQALAAAERRCASAASEPALAEASQEAKAAAIRAALDEMDGTRQKIEQAHQEWMAAIDAVDDIIFIHDADFRILRCNRAYQARAGLSFNEIVGKRYFDLFPKMDAPMHSCVLAMESSRESACDEEVSVGAETFRTRSFSVRAPDGKYRYSVHVMQDITEHKRAEDVLRASNELLHTIIENAPVRVFWKDVQLRYLGCNTLFARDAGLTTPDQLVGKDDWQMGWRDQAELYRADDARVMASGVPKLGYEEPQTTPDGRTIWLRTSKVPLRNAQGEVFGMLGMYEDVTEQRRAAEDLKVFRTLIDNSSDAIEVMEPGTLRFLDVNETSCAWLGYTRDELLGMSVYDIDAGMDEESGRHIEDEINASGSARFDTVHRRKDGTTFPVEVSLKLIELDKPYLLGVVRDISERKRSEAELLRLNRVLTTLSEGNRTMLHARDETELMSNMCRVITAYGGYALAWIGFVRHDDDKSIEPVAIAGDGEEYVRGLKLTWDDRPGGRGPTGTAVRTGTVQIVHDIGTDQRFGLWRAAAKRQGFVSSIALPMKDQETVFGTLNIYSNGPTAFTSSEEVALLEEVTSDLSFGIATLRTRLERDGAVRERQHYANRLRENMEEALQAIAATVEMRDPYTAGHQRRVAELAAAIGREMGLPEERIHGIRLAGIVHDLGKIHIPAEVLSKPGRLNDIEYGFIKVHPQAGYEILKGIEFPWPIAQAVLQHHERLDGSGYPQGLSGDAIIEEARILAVADVVEAMSSHRPYRPGLGLEAALTEIHDKRGTYYDPQVVDVCISLFREQDFRFID